MAVGRFYNQLLCDQQPMEKMLRQEVVRKVRIVMYPESCHKEGEGLFVGNYCRQIAGRCRPVVYVLLVTYIDILQRASAKPAPAISCLWCYWQNAFTGEFNMVDIGPQVQRPSFTEYVQMCPKKSCRWFIRNVLDVRLYTNPKLTTSRRFV